MGKNNRKLIAEGIDEDDELDEYIWQTKKVNEGTYYLYAIIDDHTNEPYKIYSHGSIAISFPECNVPTSGDWTVSETCIIRDNVDVTGNVLINSGATLMIGSYIKVKEGGKIK